ARTTFGRGDPDQDLPDGAPGALAARLAASYAELRALGARQEATLAPLIESARAPVLAEVPLLATDPGSLADLAAIARYLFPDPGRAAAVGVRGLERYLPALSLGAPGRVPLVARRG